MEIMEKEINEELIHISLWLKINKLSLNVKKTHYMVFTKSRIIHDLNIKIDNESIDEIEKTKFLGVIIDNKMNWKEHIAYIAGKLSRGIGMIIKARHYLNKDALLSLYYGFIYPYLTYCNQVWGATFKTNLKRLETLQNKIVRIISHVKPRENCMPLYEQLGIMRFECINKYMLGCFMYKLCSGNIPVMFMSFFKRNHELYDYNTRTINHFHIPPVKSELGKTGVRYRGAIIWNAILKDGINPDVLEAVFKKAM